MAKKHHKVKVRGKAANNQSKLSAIGDFILRMKNLEGSVRIIGDKHIVVGWADSATEQPRSKPRKIRKGNRKGQMSTVIYGEDFIGPMKKAESLATIAKRLCYGRAKGETSNGHIYNAIPARNFVEVLKNKHSKPIFRKVKDSLLPAIKKDGHPVISQQALYEIAVVAKGQLQRAIRDSNEYAPNAPSTIRAKGSARPLIDTGTLVNSLDFEIK